ncbi:hypothetical protein [Streptomyces gobitricini]|uniref:Uncharacterized protein n=1 Tax=Streptomyces gobitricini TaxID=68211 RepID=A0ABN3N9A8_9ACTN
MDAEREDVNEPTEPAEEEAAADHVVQEMSQAVARVRRQAARMLAVLPPETPVERRVDPG